MEGEGLMSCLLQPRLLLLQSSLTDTSRAFQPDSTCNLILILLKFS